MKISMFLPDLRGGGVERIRLVLAYEFARLGHDVEFVLMQARGELLDEAKASFPVVDLATPRARSVPLALARYLRGRRPSSLLAAMWPLTVIAPLAQRLSGHRCKVVVSEHAILSGEYGDWGMSHRALMTLSTRIGYRLADRRVGVSEGVAADMAVLSGMRNSAFDVIYNPVRPRQEPGRTATDNAERLWSVPKGVRILTVGTLKRVKNHQLLLRAFAQLNRSEARLMFVGDGPERESLLLLARDLGVDQRVVFAGFHHDPTPFYTSADLFVLSSNYEGFGNVIVEALACGLPVVSTNCPSGPSEILDGGQYGTLVPVGDVNSLAEGLKNSLSSKISSEKLKQRAAHFRPQVAADKYLKFLSGRN